MVKSVAGIDCNSVRRSVMGNSVSVVRRLANPLLGTDQIGGQTGRTRCSAGRLMIDCLAAERMIISQKTTPAAREVIVFASLFSCNLAAGILLLMRVQAWDICGIGDIDGF